MNTKSFVTSLYVGFLNRLPEPNAVDHWVKRIESGVSVDQVASEFIASDEFKNNLASQNLLFVPPGHFYSPIVDTNVVKHLFDNKKNIELVDVLNLNEQQQIENWKKLLPHIKKFPFSQHAQEGFRYYYDNFAYGIGDASIYFGMLLEYRPKRIIEIGSGFSSACALDVIDHFFTEKVEITFIEPYPDLLQSLLKKSDSDSVKIYPVGVQEIDINLFKSLGDGDILFIDSTHVLKTGSDVHFLLFEVLPALNPGVIIHIHDIFWPFEYPRSWVIDEKRSWNELYSLRAFLMYQDTFQIEFFNDYFTRRFRSQIEADCPSILHNTGGSLWLRKIK